MTGALPDRTPNDPDAHPSPYDVSQRSLPQDAAFIEFGAAPDPAALALLAFSALTHGGIRRNRRS